jgi:hypothetical protein
MFEKAPMPYCLLSNGWQPSESLPKRPKERGARLFLRFSVEPIAVFGTLLLMAVAPVLNGDAGAPTLSGLELAVRVRQKSKAYVRNREALPCICWWR